MYKVQDQKNIQLMESMLLLVQKLNSDNISELLDDNLASSFGLLEQDIIALNKVAMGELPIVIEVNRAADILQALRLKKIFNLDMILMSVEEAPLIIQQIKDSGVPVIIDPMDNIPNSFDELASDIKLGVFLIKMVLRSCSVLKEVIIIILCVKVQGML